jgi:hypothetical protein
LFSPKTLADMAQRCARACRMPTTHTGHTHLGVIIAGLIEFLAAVILNVMTAIRSKPINSKLISNTIYRGDNQSASISGQFDDLTLKQRALYI